MATKINSRAGNPSRILTWSQMILDNAHGFPRRLNNKNMIQQAVVVCVRECWIRSGVVRSRRKARLNLSTGLCLRTTTEQNRMYWIDRSCKEAHTWPKRYGGVAVRSTTVFQSPERQAQPGKCTGAGIDRERISLLRERDIPEPLYDLGNDTWVSSGVVRSVSRSFVG